MGCDGGSIPKRVEMVKLKKKDEKAGKDVALMARWRHCAISSQRLRQPVVACGVGKLYNKEAVIEALLDRSKMPGDAAHIKSLKDVVQLNLTVNPSFKKGDSFEDTQAAEYVCPVTGLEMSGVYRFVYLRPCCCVFSERALKEAPSKNCHVCSKPFTAEDVIVINGDEEDMKKQMTALEERRKQAKLSKKKRSASAAQQNGDKLPGEDAHEGSPPSEKRTKPNDSEKMLAEGATKVEGAEMNGGASMIKKEKKTTKPSSTVQTGATLKGTAKRMVSKVLSETTLSMEEDYSARDAYKSIFTSSEPKGKTAKAHWVTFNSYK